MGGVMNQSIFFLPKKMKTWKRKKRRKMKMLFCNTLVKRRNSHDSGLLILGYKVTLMTIYETIGKYLFCCILPVLFPSKLFLFYDMGNIYIIYIFSFKSNFLATKSTN